MPIKLLWLSVFNDRINKTKENCTGVQVKKVALKTLYTQIYKFAKNLKHNKIVLMRDSCGTPELPQLVTKHLWKLKKYKCCEIWKTIAFYFQQFHFNANCHQEKCVSAWKTTFTALFYYRILKKRIPTKIGPKIDSCGIPPLLRLVTKYLWKL